MHARARRSRTAIEREPGDHASPALVPLVFILSGETDAAATLVAACSSQAGMMLHCLVSSCLWAAAEVTLLLTSWVLTCRSEMTGAQKACRV